MFWFRSLFCRTETFSFEDEEFGGSGSRRESAGRTRTKDPCLGKLTIGKTSTHKLHKAKLKRADQVAECGGTRRRSTTGAWWWRPGRSSPWPTPSPRRTPPPDHQSLNGDWPKKGNESGLKVFSTSVGVSAFSAKYLAAEWSSYLYFCYHFHGQVRTKQCISDVVCWGKFSAQNM